MQSAQKDLRIKARVHEIVSVGTRAGDPDEQEQVSRTRIRETIERNQGYESFSAACREWRTGGSAGKANGAATADVIFGAL